MKTTLQIAIVCLALAGIVLLGAGPALATQTHGEPEGLVGHQLAHLFFMFSMGVLIYWLGARRLTRERGWRYIQYAAILLILWNVDAFAVHMLDEFTGILVVERQTDWTISIAARPGYEMLVPLYYMVKLDHLLCVPALLLLLVGINRLAREGSVRSTENTPP